MIYYSNTAPPSSRVKEQVMDPGPPELEKRCRRFFEGRGDAVAPLLCYIGSDGDARAGSKAWAALIVSRIFLLKGNVPLALAYLRLAAALSGAAGDATLRLGILVNRALVFKAQGNVRRAAELLRAVVDRALREGEIFVAAKGASNLALCLARDGAGRDGATGDNATRDNISLDALSYLGIAERYYSAVGYESGLLRVGMTRALIDAKLGLFDEAIDRLCVVAGTCAGERHFARARRRPAPHRGALARPLPTSSARARRSKVRPRCARRSSDSARSA